MKFQKGKSGNPEGRKKGAKNKSTEQLRQSLQEFIDFNIEKLQKEFDTLDAEKKLLFFEKIIKHVLPAPTSFERLSEDQLNQLHEYLLKKYKDEQTSKE